MKQIFMLGHAGSGNHGSEAIVKSTKKILNYYDDQIPIKVETKKSKEDIEYKTLKENEYIEYNENEIVNIFNKISNKIIKRPTPAYKIISKKLFNEINKDDVCLIIGGDTYCYSTPYRMYYYNKKAINKGAKTILWGCSISEEKINKKMEEDLKRYTLILARETITYENLKKHGITNNVLIYPDSAFQLNKIESPLPKNWLKGNTIGINISPMIINYEKEKGQTIANYEALIEHILKTTNSNIALIPHVVWNDNDDRKPLRLLYEKFKNTNRIILLDDYRSEELKGFISRCKLFIGARTHATIAAYSTYVPTLVIGYSVKAKGIAKDLFGTYENYVIPVQTLTDKQDLIKSYEWLNENQEKIKDRLKKIIPDYKQKSLEAGEKIIELMR